MSGHSKWAKIKHQKTAGDAKKGRIFSKLSKMITLAAKKGEDQNMNPELKYAINQAKAENMPSSNIQKAIRRGGASSKEENLEEVRYEAFGPGGAAIIVEGITDSKNRTSAEIKQIFNKNDVRLAEPGAAVWAFEKNPEGQWQTKNIMPISPEDKEKLQNLINTLEEHEDINKIFTNAE